jgi:hypothetical protein
MCFNNIVLCCVVLVISCFIYFFFFQIPIDCHHLARPIQQCVHLTDTPPATRGIAGEHSSMYCGYFAFGLTNRGSRGITVANGERSTQTDDAVTFVAMATTGCPDDALSILGGPPAAFSLVRSAHSLNTNAIPVATRYRWRGHPRAG